MAQVAQPESVLRPGVWQRMADPARMIRRLEEFAPHRFTHRQRGLYVCACGRAVWEFLPPPGRQLVEAREAYEFGRGDWAAVDASYAAATRALGANDAAMVALAAGDEGDEVLCGTWAAEALALAPGAPRALVLRRRFAAVLRDVVGDPARPVTADPAWLTPTARAIARHVYEFGDFSPLPILADALQDAGCDSTALLAHCRGGGPHVPGCWAIDLVLGEEVTRTGSSSPAAEADRTASYLAARAARAAERAASRA
jgi:hypothetical protein